MKTVRINPDTEELLFQRMETEGEGEVERRVIVSEGRVDVVSEDGDRGRGGGGQQEAGAGGHSTAGGQGQQGEERLFKSSDDGILHIDVYKLDGIGPVDNRPPHGLAPPFVHKRSRKNLTPDA